MRNVGSCDLSIGWGSGRRPVHHTKEPSSVNAAGIQGGLVPRQDSIFLTSYFSVLFSFGKSFQIETHVPGGRPPQTLGSHLLPAHPRVHSLSICDCALAPKFLVSSHAGCKRNPQCSVVLYLTFKKCMCMGLGPTSSVFKEVIFEPSLNNGSLGAK